MIDLVDSYRKIKEGNVELQATSPTDIVVSNGSKIRSVVERCLTSLQDQANDTIKLQASGKNITKTISCAEILKRKRQVTATLVYSTSTILKFALATIVDVIQGLYQRNEIYYQLSEDIWEPQKEGLENLKVKRHIPAMTITLSKNAMDVKLSGYQGPSNIMEVRRDHPSRGGRRGRGGNHPRRGTNNRRRNVNVSNTEYTERTKMDSRQSDNVKSFTTE
ncbi:Ribonuclease P protein subunit p25-like protein [Trichoplax sp. H2]|nr:Ribonuclease P protein subunit p25-like protein [Trichoplax sp. H2]|eukprot:RDD42803.1 Ribonuclease P protein subunit p25-like protein [Trichoplax sp. H2]